MKKQKMLFKIFLGLLFLGNLEFSSSIFASCEEIELKSPSLQKSLDRNDMCFKEVCTLLRFKYENPLLKIEIPRGGFSKKKGELVSFPLYPEKGFFDESIEMDIEELLSIPIIDSDSVCQKE